MGNFRTNEDGVSPVIGVILMVAITVVLVSILYVVVTGFAQQLDYTPRGALIFKEDITIDGKYSGGYHGSIYYEDIEVKVTDVSGEGAVNFEPATEKFQQIPGGLNITFFDLNTNAKLDGSDLILIEGGDDGDEVSIIYKLNHEIIGSAVLN
jgi:flagellin-like protein